MVQEVWLMRTNTKTEEPNIKKQHQKLIRLNKKAEKCVTRDQARKILKKALKAERKIHERAVCVYENSRCGFVSLHGCAEK